MDPNEQILTDALPATGDVLYADYVAQLTAAGNASALKRFHAMRRAGQITTRLESGSLYVGRGIAQEPAAG